MTWLIVVSLLMPLALIAWLAFAPATTRLRYIVQVISTGAMLVAIANLALWTALPWWLPRLYGALWVGAAVFGAPRSRFGSAPWYPRNVAEWASLTAMWGLFVVGAYLSWLAWDGRRLPDVRSVSIPLPFESGMYLVAHGGSNPLVNGHMRTLDPRVDRFRAYRGQSYGIDLIEIDGLGLRSSGLQPEDPQAYEIYGQPLYAPCDGTVIGRRSDRPDMPVPVMDQEILEGNHVLLQCDDFVLLLAHLRQGSVEPRIGDDVSRGDLLGEVGNSGRTTEPHLHLSAQRLGLPGAPLAGEPLALLIDGRYLVRNDRIRAGTD